MSQNNRKTGHKSELLTEYREGKTKPIRGEGRSIRYRNHSRSAYPAVSPRPSSKAEKDPAKRKILPCQVLAFLSDGAHAPPFQPLYSRYRVSSAYASHSVVLLSGQRTVFVPAMQVRKKRFPAGGYSYGEPLRLPGGSQYTQCRLYGENSRRAPHRKNGTAFLPRGIIETVWINAEPLSFRANENLTQL